MKCKYIVGIMMMITCFWGMQTVQATHATNISIEVPENAKTEDMVHAKVMVQDVENVMGLKMDVTYDSDVLEYVSDQAGEKAKGMIHLSEHVEDEERIRAGIVALLGFKESGCYYEVQFKVKEVASTTTTVGVEVAELTDAQGNAIAHTEHDAQIEIEGIAQEETAQEEISTDTTSETSEEEMQERSEEITQEEMNQIINKEEIIDPTQAEPQVLQISMQGKQNQNIKNVISMQQPEGLQWEVQDVQIVELQEDGTIVPKQVGSTHIMIIDESGNVIQEVAVKVTEEAIEEELNMTFITVLAIVCALVGTVIGYQATRIKMNKK